jgi:hypothetical protein
MVLNQERSWTASLKKFSKCCGTIPLFPPSKVLFLVMFLMMPTLVGQVTGFCSTNLILFTLSTLFDSVPSSSAKRDTGGHSVQERSPEETIIIAELLQKFSDTFSKNDTDLGLTNLVEHHIETGDAKPLKQPPRRVPMAYAEDEKKLIDTMQTGTHTEIQFTMV